jgi:hypothetical protein
MRFAGAKFKRIDIEFRIQSRPAGDLPQEIEHD